MHIATPKTPPLFGLDHPQVWSTELAFQHLQKQGQCDTKRTAERKLNSTQILPPILSLTNLYDEQHRPVNQLILNWDLEQTRKRRERILFIQLYSLPNQRPCLHANDARGARFWIPLTDIEKSTIHNALELLQKHIGKALTLYPHGELTSKLRDFIAQPYLRVSMAAYAPTLTSSTNATTSKPTNNKLALHLQRLEAESIHIIREAVATADNPVMLYSIGKDSGVMLHLARKAFYPAPPPFPLLHVDTQWKFQEMYLFRDWMVKESGMRLLTYINPEAIEKNINPFTHGSELHTDITKTEALKQALNHYKFDVIFGGARRDEEKSRAKERIFSFRNNMHRWDPRKQRPEIWSLYNTRKNSDESIRVFPLSNWTELDIWQYIYQENIPIVPLYLAKTRPIVERAGMIMMIDDDRCQLLPGEEIQLKKIRFRTLGCYPLTGAIESQAETLEDIIIETINAKESERQGRKIDTDSSNSMEKKKQEGYF